MITGSSIQIIGGFIMHVFLYTGRRFAELELKLITAQV